MIKKSLLSSLFFATSFSCFSKGENIFKNLARNAQNTVCVYNYWQGDIIVQKHVNENNQEVTYSAKNR